MCVVVLFLQEGLDTRRRVGESSIRARLTGGGPPYINPQLPSVLCGSSQSTRCHRLLWRHRFFATSASSCLISSSASFSCPPCSSSDIIISTESQGLPSYVQPPSSLPPGRPPSSVPFLYPNTQMFFSLIVPLTSPLPQQHRLSSQLLLFFVLLRPSPVSPDGSFSHLS